MVLMGVKGLNPKDATAKPEVFVAMEQEWFLLIGFEEAL